VKRTLQAVAALTAVYLLALASTKPGDIAAGVLVAVAALAVARRAPRATTTGGLRSLLALPRLLAATLADVVRGTWEMALVVLGLRPATNAGVVEVPIGPRTDAGTVVSALASTLSPGEVLLDIDAERGVYVLHVFDASDPDAVRERHLRGYERNQRGAVP